ncbi:MAG: hypothetical protein HOO17_08700 [Bacteroidetes Order II. Incertae sedis bacterium]|nr:hypothetical protein [Bacteroidetes Order II. bacterium]
MDCAATVRLVHTDIISPKIRNEAATPVLKCGVTDLKFQRVFSIAISPDPVNYPLPKRKPQLAYEQVEALLFP